MTDSMLVKTKKAVSSNKLTAYNIFLMLMFAAVRGMFCVHKNMISYAYGFQGVGSTATADFMITKAFPGLAPIYGIVSNSVHSSLYAFGSLLLSGIASKWNPRAMLAISIVGFSLMTLGQGFTNSLTVFIGLRALFGLFASGINVPTYTLISQEFDEENRTTANSFDSAGYYIGGGISSLMLVVIQKFGWRTMF